MALLWERGLRATDRRHGKEQAPCVDRRLQDPGAASGEGTPGGSLKRISAVFDSPVPALVPYFGVA